MTKLLIIENNIVIILPVTITNTEKSFLKRKLIKNVRAKN